MISYRDDDANGGDDVGDGVYVGDGVPILKTNDGDGGVVAAAAPDAAVPNVVVVAAAVARDAAVAVVAETVGFVVAVVDGFAVLELRLEVAEYYSAQSLD